MRKGIVFGILTVSLALGILSTRKSPAQETREETVKEAEKAPPTDTSVRIRRGAHIAVIGKTAKGQYWETVQKGMKAAIKDLNEAYGFEKEDQLTMTYEAADSEADMDTQINTLEAVIAENPDVVCLSAIDMDSCQPQLESARENGIPVVAFDSSVSQTDLITAFRASDNVQIGQLGASHLASTIHNTGKVAVFSAQGKTHSIRERIRGFEDTMAAYPDIRIVEIIYVDEVDDMEKAMQDTLTRYPSLAGVFCTNADISDLYLNMKKGEEALTVKMVGVDATTRQQQAVRKGEEVGVVSQDPYAIGYQTIMAAAWATAPLGTVQIPSQLLIEPAWISRYNINLETLENYLY